MQRKLDQIEIEFCKSLKNWFENEYKPNNKGAVSKLANILGISQGHMSQILACQKCFKSEYERREVAKKLGLSYTEMVGEAFSAIGINVKAGAKLHKRMSQNEIVEYEHIDIVKQFKNKEIAKAIDERLLALEKIDSSVLNRVVGYLDGLASGYEFEIIDRRKADHPEKIPGTGDRRRAAG